MYVLKGPFLNIFFWKYLHMRKGNGFLKIFKILDTTVIVASFLLAGCRLVIKNVQFTFD